MRCEHKYEHWDRRIGVGYECRFYGKRILIKPVVYA
jgi:hypothetical protein